MPLARRRNPAGLLPLVAALGCPPGADTAGPDPCGLTAGWKAGGERFALVHVPVPDGEPVVVEVVQGGGAPLLPDGPPVVVVVQGGFVPSVSPASAEDLLLRGPSGTIQLFVTYPSAPGEDTGMGDLRGPLARGALAAALRYGAGTETDTDGCTLADRVDRAPSLSPPLVFGRSNGGNLAIATLADPALDLPELAGLAGYEVPAGPQFVNLELGHGGQLVPGYVAGACTWTPIGGITCPVPTAHLAWGPEIVSEGRGPGAFYYDEDGDGAWTADRELAIHCLRPEADEGPGQLQCSPSLARAAEDLGLGVVGLASPEAAEDFWLPRDGSRQAAALAARRPDLPVLLLGTEVDHAQPLPDHAHVTHLAAALSEAGLAWVRVNPDAAYVSALTGVEAGFADNPANLADPLLAGMEPEEVDVGIPLGVYLEAAVRELLERTWAGDWRPDLEAPLLP